MVLECDISTPYSNGVSVSECLAVLILGNSFVHVQEKPLDFEIGWVVRFSYSVSVRSILLPNSALP